MTRSVARIDPLLAKLREAWIASPDLRLTQLLWSVVNSTGGSATSFLYTEDDVVMNKLTARLLPSHEHDWRDTGFANLDECSVCQVTRTHPEDIKHQAVVTACTSASMKLSCPCGHWSAYLVDDISPEETRRSYARHLLDHLGEPDMVIAAPKPGAE